jgi:mannosyltransferase
VTEPGGRARDLQALEVLHPNLHRRYSGVTTTILAVAPRMAKLAKTALVGRMTAAGVETIGLRDVISLGASVPPTRPRRIWHSRRNDEMITALILRRLFGLKLGLVFTSAAQRHHTGLSRWLMGQQDALICPSPEAAGYLTRPCTIVFHGVDPERYHPPADRAADWAATGLPGKYGIGVFGRVRAQKGTDLFIEAMVRLLPRHPDFTAVVIGLATPKDRPYEEALRRKVEQVGLADRIIFLGELPAAEVPGWFRKLSIFVGPQRNEGFGLTTLEAMASGMAVVATTAGAAAHLVEEDVTGHLVAIEDQGALNARLDSLMADLQKVAAFGIAGRARVLERFAIDREAEGIFRVYESVWAKGARQPRVDANISR